MLRLVREMCMEEEELVMLMLLEAKGRSSHISNKQKRRRLTTIIGLMPCKDNNKCNTMCCLTKNDG